MPFRAFAGLFVDFIKSVSQWGKWESGKFNGINWQHAGRVEIRRRQSGTLTKPLPSSALTRKLIPSSQSNVSIESFAQARTDCQNPGRPNKKMAEHVMVRVWNEKLAREPASRQSMRISIRKRTTCFTHLKRAPEIHHGRHTLIPTCGAPAQWIPFSQSAVRTVAESFATVVLRRSIVGFAWKRLRICRAGGTSCC